MLTERRHHLETVLETTLEERTAGGFVVAGVPTDPTVRYCLVDPATGPDASTVAVGFDGEAWLVVTDADAGGDHPADHLATELAERNLSSPILTPSDLPHDAALYLEQAGLSLASSDAVDRARVEPTADERDRIEAAQSAARRGLERAGTALEAASTEDGTLALEGAALTGERLRRLVDEAIVAAGGLPAGNTTVDAGDMDVTAPLPAAAPIVVSVAPRTSDGAGYHGGLTRTFVVDGEGGRERRAHVAAESALKSATAMLRADSQSATAVANDLRAEVTSFGFDGGIDADVAGVGLEPRERPTDGDAITDGAIVRLEVAVTDVTGGGVRLADLVAVDGTATAPLESPPRSIVPRRSG